MKWMRTLIDKLTRPLWVIEFVVCCVILESFGRVLFVQDHSVVQNNAVSRFIEAYPVIIVVILFAMVVMALLQLPALLFERWKYSTRIRSAATFVEFTGYIFIALICIPLFGFLSVVWINSLAIGLICAALHLGIRLSMNGQL